MPLGWPRPSLACKLVQSARILTHEANRNDLHRASRTRSRTLSCVKRCVRCLFVKLRYALPSGNLCLFSSHQMWAVMESVHLTPHPPFPDQASALYCTCQTAFRLQWICQELCLWFYRESCQCYPTTWRTPQIHPWQHHLTSYLAPLGLVDRLPQFDPSLASQSFSNASSSSHSASLLRSGQTNRKRPYALPLCSENHLRTRVLDLELLA